jgi:hypothetical protein
MAYLNNTSVVIDAILTKKGRELLARNDGSFQITQFSLADDEVDYSLYNPYHPSGSAFYGEAIQAMPIIQAYPEDQEIMKYKLLTLPRGTGAIPVISSVASNVQLVIGQPFTITPSTANYNGSSTFFETSGYQFTIGDVRTMSSFTATGINTPAATSLNNTVTIGTNVSKTVIGTTLNMTATTVKSLFGSSTSSVLTTTLTVVGRDSGARLTVLVTITQS